MYYVTGVIRFHKLFRTLGETLNRGYRTLGNKGCLCLKEELLVLKFDISSYFVEIIAEIVVTQTGRRVKGREEKLNDILVAELL